MEKKMVNLNETELDSVNGSGSFMSKHIKVGCLDCDYCEFFETAYEAERAAEKHNSEHRNHTAYNVGGF